MKLTLVSLVGAATSLVITAAVAGCGGADEFCDCAPTGVIIDVGGGLVTSDIRSIATSGVCGPAPRPFCSAGEECDAAFQAQHDWQITLPAHAAGECRVVIELESGAKIAETVHVTESTGDCCVGARGDRRLAIGPTK